MKRKWLVLLTAPCLGTTTASAQSDYLVMSTLGSDTLVSECAKHRGLELDICSSYILGIFDALILSRAICPTPSGVATMQAVEVVQKYLRDHPEKWSQAPGFLVADPLKAAFPCRPRK